MIRMLFALLPFLFSSLMTDSGGGDDKDDRDTGKDDSDDKDDKSRIEWTPEQQRELQRITAKESRKAADKARQDEKDRIAAEKASADTEAQRKRDEEAGEFAKVRTSLETERDDAKSSLTTATTELDALRTYFTTQFDAAIKDLPDVVKAFAPATDASFETKSHWLTTAQAEARKLDKQKPRGSGFDPTPGGDRGINEQQEVAKVRQRPAFRSL